MASAPVRRILDRVLRAGHGWGCSVADGAALLRVTTTEDVAAIAAAADALRRAAPCGDRVSYVVNRNINFTNACVKRCGFCAFSRTARDTEAYYLPQAEILRRVAEGVALGATEVCVQAGLPLKDATGQRFTGHGYLRMIADIRAAHPQLHIHALSPEEVLWGAQTAKLRVPDFLRLAVAAGLNSLPGTSAEVLDDEVRQTISPGRLTTAQWVDVVRTAHGAGLRTSSTLMYGHVEQPEHVAAHLALLRDVQADTGGFTEFVPLSFVASEAPMFRDLQTRTSLNIRAGPTGRAVLLVHAVARIMLAGSIDNLQVSWPKEGLRMAQVLLGCGVNDLGGVLMNESISSAAGAPHGQLATPAALRAVVRDAGRLPVQRTTTYGVVREFSGPAEGDEKDPLDTLTEAASANLGSYQQLTRDARWRVRDAWARPTAVAAGVVGEPQEA